MPFDRTRFDADPVTVRDALMRLQGGAVLGPLDADQRDCVLLVLAEVLNNVAEHAYDGAAGPVAVSLRLRGGSVVARVVDQGRLAPPMDAASDPDPDTLPEGGFGLGLIRALASGIDQRRRMGCNVLRFHLGTQAEAGLRDFVEFSA